jgi:hypothetical protein
VARRLCHPGGDDHLPPEFPVDLFRQKSDEERRYFEVTPGQRWTMAVMYFGLVALLVAGMKLSHIPKESLQ